MFPGFSELHIFFLFFFPFASPPSSETESLTKLDRLVCPLSFLCTSECVLESRVTDDVALRWFRFCGQVLPLLSVPIIAWLQSCPLSPWRMRGVGRARLVSAAPAFPHPALQGCGGRWGAESVEKVCLQNSHQGACPVLLGFMPQVPLYCRPLPFDLSLTSCLLHTFPCLSGVLALKSLVFLLCCLQRT